MISHPTSFPLRLQDGWRVAHQSAYVTLGVSKDGNHRFLLVRLFTQAHQPITDIHDGALTCYLDQYLRTEYLEGNRTGYFVSGYLNLRQIDGYALYSHREAPGRLLLLATGKGAGSLADLRQRALTLADQLGLDSGEDTAAKGY